MGLLAKETRQKSHPGMAGLRGDSPYSPTGKKTGAVMNGANPKNSQKSKK